MTLLRDLIDTTEPARRSRMFRQGPRDGMLLEHTSSMRWT